MLFSSLPFLYYFLPIVLALYFLAPKCLKNTVLLASSLFFYAWGEPKFVIFMVVAIVQGYIFGLLVERYRSNKGLAKLFLTLSVGICLALLGYCKYADFFIENFNALTGLSIPLLKVVLPIGISFYTFQILSYVVDVYRGDCAAQKNPIDLGAYIALFPQLIAGPIVRYVDIEKELTDRKTTLEDMAYGARRFVLGLSKKVLIANILYELIVIFKATADPSVLFNWIYIGAYMLHIYFDFSGYSDMAVGLGRIFGFHFLENFDHPYISRSVTEFWRRWHMSLGTWFRDYVYIPLGGNRVGPFRRYFNIFAVWFLTGMWHGAAWNFAIWGLMFAVLLILEKAVLLKWLKNSKVLSHIYVLIMVAISFVFFDAANLSAATDTLGAMFGLKGLPLSSLETAYYFRSFALTFLVAIVGATPGPKMLVEKLSAHKAGRILIDILEPIVLVGLLLVCTGYLVDGSFNPFLYFRF